MTQNHLAQNYASNNNLKKEQLDNSINGNILNDKEKNGRMNKNKKNEKKNKNHKGKIDNLESNYNTNTPYELNGKIEDKNNKKTPEKFTRKLNIEFNEVSTAYKGVTEIIKYSTDPNSTDCGNPKIIKLDHNLHSEKLLLQWEKPQNKTEKDFELFKKRNIEYKNLKNIIKISYEFSKLNEWNILINLQNMFIEDNIRKTYKIEKSNINLQDYSQKLH